MVHRDSYIVPHKCIVLTQEKRLTCPELYNEKQKHGKQTMLDECLPLQRFLPQVSYRCGVQGKAIVHSERHERVHGLCFVTVPLLGLRMVEVLVVIENVDRSDNPPT